MASSVALIASQRVTSAGGTDAFEWTVLRRPIPSRLGQSRSRVVSWHGPGAGRV
jgi:hypothetical protein